MITLNYNPMFEEKTLYSFQEVQEIIWDYSGVQAFPPTSQTMLDVLDYFGFTNQNENKNLYGLTFVSLQTPENDDPYLLVDDRALTLIAKMMSRYKDHWAIMCDDDTQATKLKKSKELFTKIINLLDYNFPKFTLLLTAYESKKNNMLDKLGRTRSGSREISSSGETSDSTLNLFNDTPQTSDVVATIEGNQYVSELNKGSNSGTSSSSGSDEFEEEENFDTKTIMEKLEEIQRNYAKIWKVWLDEFDELFIEEVNF